MVTGAQNVPVRALSGVNDKFPIIHYYSVQQVKCITIKK